MTDIFGQDTSKNLDVSDEALADRWEDDTTQEEPGAATSTSSEEAPDDPPADPGQEQPSENSTDDTAADVQASESVEVPAKLEGKTPDEILRINTELDRVRGEQANELGQLRQLVAQQQQQIDALLNLDAADTDIADQIQQSPHRAIDAYNSALAALDRGELRDVGVIQNIIRSAKQIDTDLGDTMDRDFAMRMTRAEVMAQMKPVQDTAYRTNLNLAVNQLWNDTELGADFQAYAEDVQAMLKGQGQLGLSDAEITQRLKSALITARGQDPTRSAAYRAQLEAAKQNAQVEEPNAVDTPQPTEADKIREGIYSRRAAASELFAGFGGQ